MKKIIVLLLCLHGSSLFGQTEWGRSMPNFGFPSAFTSSSDSSWITVETFFDQNNYSFGRFKKFNKNGTPLKSQSSQHVWEGRFSNVISDKNNNIYACGNWGFVCDIHTERGFVLKYDSNLDSVWRYNSPFSSTEFTYTNMYFDSKNNLKILCDTRNHHSKYSYLVSYNPSTGKEIGIDTIPMDSAIGIAITKNDGALLVFNNKIVKIDSNAKISWSKKFTAIKNIKKIDDSRFVLLTSTNVIVIDSLATVIKSNSWGKDYGRILDMAVTDSTIFVMAQDINMKYVAVKYNLSLMKIWQKTINDQVAPFFISAQKNSLAVAGIDSSDKGMNHLFIKAIDTTNTFTKASKDIGISGISGGKLSLFYSYYPYQMEWRVPIDATIKNYGTKIIDSCAVYTIGSEGGMCFNSNYYKVFNKLNLKSGDTTTVHLGDYIVSSYGTNPHMSLKVSLGVCSPDFELDANPANNYSSQTFVYTGTEKETAFGTNILLFPNPATNSLTIQSANSLNGTYSIYNQLGQKQTTGFLNNETQKQIDIQNLAAGMYFIEVKSEGVTEQIKFVKLP